jgi:hypothetical protein
MTGRAVLRAIGAVLALTAALSIGVLTSSGAPASATTGASWAGAGAALPPNAVPNAQSELLATSCPAPGNCVSVGAYLSTGGGEATGLIETQSDGTWTAAQAPVLAGTAGQTYGLLSVDCVAVGSCTAGGILTGMGGTEDALLFTETAGVWSVVAAPLPPDAAANPDEVVLSLSCAAPGSCVAAGIYTDTSHETRALLLTQAAGTWTLANAPLPPGASATQEAYLLHASCPAVGSCAAVGEYLDGGGHFQGLILTQSGGAWSATEAPLPDAGPTSAGGLLSVSCPAAGSCMAVGEYDDAAGNLTSLVESIANGTVTPSAPPLPSDAVTSGTSPAPVNQLASVACPSTQYCVATGAYAAQTNTGEGTSPLIETYSGGNWTATRAPGSFDPSFESAVLAVSCSWPGSCSAFGTSLQGTALASGFLETLSNGTWSETPAVLPSDAVVPSLVRSGPIPGLAGQPISCVAGTCVLSGTYTTTASLVEGFFNSFPNLGGYQLAASDGGLFAFNAPFFGSMGGQPLNQPVVGMAVVPDSGGYYEVASDGGIFAFNAPFFGSMGGQHLNQPIVGIAFDSLTGGYYEVASDGGIFAFNAPFYGSMGGQHLNKPIVGIGFDAATGGYYEVASDGGIFAFNAPFMGSTGSLTLNKPMVGMSYDNATGGYYEVASDGGIFAFGAPFQGSTGSLTLNKPVVGMAYDYVTGGYYEVASDGGIFAFGAPFQGSTGSLTLNKPVVGMSFG